MEDLLKENSFIMMEAAVVEPLRRTAGITLHPELVHAPMIYDEIGRDELKKLFSTYIKIALESDLPFFMCTPTWRTNHDRVMNSDINRSVNVDSVTFMKEIKSSFKNSENIRIGGMIGCKNDCYLPDEALSVSEAEAFHAWQIEQLAEGGADFLIAETIPSVEEATGIALAMEKCEIPYIISFVIDRNGLILDGTSLTDAVERIDSVTKVKPLGYMVNCVYPTFLNASLQPEKLYERLIGCLGNASSLDHCDLDGADELQLEEVSHWGSEMLTLNKKYGVKIMGGCCGTEGEHLQYLADNR